MWGHIYSNHTFTNTHTHTRTHTRILAYHLMTECNIAFLVSAHDDVDSKVVEFCFAGGLNWYIV